MSLQQRNIQSITTKCICCSNLFGKTDRTEVRTQSLFLPQMVVGPHRSSLCVCSSNHSCGEEVTDAEPSRTAMLKAWRHVCQKEPAFCWQRGKSRRPPRLFVLSLVAEKRRLFWHTHIRNLALHATGSEPWEISLEAIAQMTAALFRNATQCFIPFPPLPKSLVPLGFHRNQIAAPVQLRVNGRLKGVVRGERCTSVVLIDHRDFRCSFDV